MVNKEDKSDSFIKITEIRKKDVWTVRVLISCGLTVMGIFVWWFVDPEHIGYQPIFWLLTMGLLFKLVKMLHEWYHYWNPTIPVPPVLKTRYTVDILTTACPGEPREMIIQTLRAMNAITYPHTNYLCDEGNDPILKKVCDELGIVHVTRTVKINAKAGNINNALKQATGDICIVLDPDHIPVPEFIDRVLPYFEDPEVGYVQCIQGYGNQEESIIARGAAEQTYHFYGPMMMCMNTYGTVQAIGANCTFRRSALDSIGGHAAGLSEDMHTAMQLHAKGWKSLYIPEMLTRGLVPATLSSYYKQQLKWSRGTFELLFRTLPSLFPKLTWRQKIHYFTIPLYFLFGLINFIDILIPLLALSLAQVPWAVDIQDFGMFFLPLCGLSLTIRLFAQRWLMEKHERGLHLAGGILRTATWWIFLIGFIYAIFNVNVPYIPTPKEDEHENYIKLSIPNLLIALICAAGIVFGLKLDWSPYSIAMAFYGLINGGMLFFIVMMSQQRLLDSVTYKIKSFSYFKSFNKYLNDASYRIQHILFGLLRNGAVALLIGSALLFLSYSSADKVNNKTAYPNQKDFGGFYSGIKIDDQFNSVKKSTLLEQELNTKFQVIAFDADLMNPISSKLNLASSQHAMPLINWELPGMNDSVFSLISTGYYNNYLDQIAHDFRTYAEPVFINFSPGFDAQINSEKKTPYQFVKAWQYVYTYFNNLGISNLTWVWSPKNPASLQFYPGPKFVDWVGASCLNYAAPGHKDHYTFTELFSPFWNKLAMFQKPFMITELGSVSGEGQAEWFKDAFHNIKEKYTEIRGAILFNENKTTVKYVDGSLLKYSNSFSFTNADVLMQIAKNYKEISQDEPVFLPQDNMQHSEHKTYKSAFVKGDPGKFQLIINGKPYYIKGVAYNTAHDWRDGNMPLTRRQVEKDFARIKEMGANTIRRYDHGIYDRNILNIANEYGLQVMYGFWFDPKIDYYKDSVKVKEYMDDVIEEVKTFKDYPAVMCWSIGNESWGLLKHHYAKPYLVKVREGYLKMIEELAIRIHEIDPSHPIFSSIEHEEYQLPGEIAALHDGAPSLDGIGINSYYKEQISRLNSVFYQFDSLRPYVVSEFGPIGYWDPNHNKTSNGLLIEENEEARAKWYSYQWKNYVEAFKGYNVGGIAYCWHDRMEGSNTWFGLTDYKGRTKPAYYALKSVWTKKPMETIPYFSIESPHTIKPGNTYEFKAVMKNHTDKKITYEWSLNKDEYLKKVKGISYDENENTIMVTIPQTCSTYRLYLYATDEKGNVSTASVPIKIY